MSLKTNLNQPPYYADYDPTKDYVHTLFQPGVSVQTRELNNLQLQFQKQIERFGDNIFTSGTIVSGCNFLFLNPYPYIKIRDLTFEGQAAIPYRYVNYNVINESTGLVAWVTAYLDGFESTDPDLKTLYVNYQNTGEVGSNTMSFTSGDVLKVYDPIMNGIENININNGGIGFSNTDQLLAISSFVISISSGSFSVGDYMVNNFGANVQITAIDANTYASSNQSIIQVKPRAVDLANTAVNSSAWTVELGQALTNPANTAAAQIKQVIGQGFQGVIATDAVGTIQSIGIRSKGTNYVKTPPYITVRSINNTTGYATLNLTAKNYLTKLLVASSPSAVGEGYAFAVTEGVVYQKGYFLRVVPQQIVVSKYSVLPDNVAVGFITTEQVVNYNIDTSLLDNVNNTQNQQAPGADRLKMMPVLSSALSNAASANSEFLTIVEWKDGRPYKQNQTTIYSAIGDEMATRTVEASGDFVIDPFLVTTRSPIVANDEGKFFNILIDPGKAYIDGYRVNTLSNYNLNDEKGTDTIRANNHAISLNYGNYIIVNNVGGTFQFNTGDTVDLYDTAANFLANTTLIRTQTMVPGGNKIGVASLRSFLLQDNAPGTSAATYRLYLFDIQMNATKNFRDVRSVYYNGAKKGVADVVLTRDATTTNLMAALRDTNKNRLTFDVGVETLMNANDVSYLYRTCDQLVNTSNGNTTAATVVIDRAGNADETFPYVGSLSSVQMQDLIVIPTGAELVANAASAGTVVANNLTANMIGTTTTFLTDFAVGDWVYVGANSVGGNELHQIRTISNNTFLTIDGNNAFANVTGKLTRAFPQNVPIPFGYRSGLTANVNATQSVLTLNLGMAFTFSGSKTMTVAFNILRSAPVQSTKSPVRNRFVRIACSNNAGNTVGPWCIGVPDVFRLRGVYVGNATVSNTSSNQIKNFYVDHNQNANYYDLSWLMMISQSSIPLTTDSYILVQFDYFTSSGTGGFFDTVSYTASSNLQQIFIQDSQPLSNLTSYAHSFEVPELFTDDGTEIDLLNQIDFRPRVANTVAPATTPAAAPLNPGATSVLSTTGEKKFPLPDSLFTSDIEYYIGRIDSVYVDKSSRFAVIRGPASQFKERQIRPTVPDNSMRIIDLVIPPYPNLPTYYSTDLDAIINTGVMNQKYLTTRIKNKTIQSPTSNTMLPYLQPRVYTNYDIGKLDRRLTDVEYISALTALEAGLSRQFIPSSVDPTLDRFKFGFMVDDFHTATFSDLTNPQYWALKEDFDIVPPKMTFDVTLPGGTPDWVDGKIIAQDLATIGSIDDPLGLGPVCALNMANSVAYDTKFRNASDILKSANPSGITDVMNLTLAASTTIYSTVNYVDTPLNEYLLTHQFDAFKNFSLSANYQVNITDPAFAGLSGSIQDLINFINASGLQFDLRVVDQGTFDAISNIFNQFVGTGQSFGFGVGGGHEGQVGVEQSTAYSFPAFISYLQNIIANAQVNPVTKPAGGQFIDTIYYPPVVLYFYNYDKPNLIEIFQNNNLIIDTRSAQALTPADINLLTGTGGQQWFNDNPEFFLKPFQDTGSGYVTYAGKITFNYDPAGGTNLTIKATSPHSIRWRYVIAYPIDGAAVGCVPPNRIFNVPPTFTANYQNVNIVNWCGNSRVLGVGQASILTSYTETWAPFSIPAATTSVIPFDITANWYGNR